MGVEIIDPTAVVEGTLAFAAGEFRRKVSGRLRLGFSSKWTRYGLRRDLRIPIEHPKAKIPIDVRPMRPEDIDRLMPVTLAGMSHEERSEIMWRRDFARRRIEGCYVAVDLRDGTPCYMQWLVGPEENEFVAALDGFPPLAPDEALLENAYTPPSHRGLGIMSAAMTMIAEKAEGLGARYVMTYVLVDNLASLKGCERSGFRPHLLHHGSQYGYRLFRRHRYVPLSADDPRRTASFFAG